MDKSAITMTADDDWWLERVTMDGEQRYPERIRVGSLENPRVYVPERTCRMVDCGSHDTCVVNRELGNGNIASMEFGYKQCSECGTYVFDCPTVRYCPSCGSRVVEDDA